MTSGDQNADVLWSGERKTLTSQATGGKVTSARYKITTEFLVFEAGLMSTTEERVPLWALGDADLKQSMTQKARGLGDITIRVLNNYLTNRDRVTLESIADPKAVRDLLDREIARTRAEHRRQEQTQHVEHLSAPPPLSPPQVANTTGELSSRSTMELLAELHRRGVFDDAEFGALVARSNKA